MTSKEHLELIGEVISTMDSFQQDYGQLRYSFTVSSYANRHLIVVHIFHNNDKMDFVIDETNKQRRLNRMRAELLATFICCVITGFVCYLIGYKAGKGD